MANVNGEVVLSARGKEYRFHFGMTAIANLQAKHGQDVLSRLEKPAGAAENWVPDLGIVIDLLRESLMRYHAADLAADAYLVDDVVAENQAVLAEVLNGSTPEAEPGNGKRPKAGR